MNKRQCFAILAAAYLLSPTHSSAQRSDNRGIYAAASQYREAVVYFEKLVVAVRGIQRTDERLVDKLEEATKRLRLAARNPRHSSRLRKEWSEIQTLQYQVESVIFGKYTLHHDLVRAWQHVLYTQAIFYEEYTFHLDNPRHGNRVGRRISTSNPQRFIPPPPASSGRIYQPLSSLRL